MSDILDLEGWTLLTRTQEDGWDILDAEYRPQPAACPKCGTIGHLYRHGAKLTTYLDIPIRGAPGKEQNHGKLHNRLPQRNSKPPRGSVPPRRFDKGMG